MEVNFDGLRKCLISDYNSLTEKLNSKLDKKSWSSDICIDPDYIQREMDGIRNAIVTLAFSYIDGEDGFKTLPDETHFEVFNSEEE